MCRDQLPPGARITEDLLDKLAVPVRSRGDGRGALLPENIPPVLFASDELPINYSPQPTCEEYETRV